MTTQPRQGGRRPVDRILGPSYLDGLTDAPIAQVRELRHEAEQEEVDLSYARRLLQGRLDLLRAEQARRAAHAAAGSGPRSDVELAHDLARALTEGPRQDHGLGRHLAATPTRVGEHRRAAEQAVADVSASDPAALDDAALSAAVARVAALEQDASTTRHRVQQVMDALTAELARRYREGEASVEDVLAGGPGAR